ncbi:hypothetical protein ERO13_D05G062401v2 [Gossypium hirsutum]|nr:hypothetical protein ERO13_D05G062401v2 [Gossypium hirsutum]
MKRASRNRQYNNNSVDEEARARLKHQSLLQEFLELQKEFVSKKNKLETVNQMRGSLLNEVRFLRQRYSYLSMVKSREYGLQKILFNHKIPTCKPRWSRILVSMYLLRGD